MIHVFTIYIYLYIHTYTDIPFLFHHVHVIVFSVWLFLSMHNLYFLQLVGYFVK